MESCNYCKQVCSLNINDQADDSDHLTAPKRYYQLQSMGSQCHFVYICTTEVFFSPRNTIRVIVLLAFMEE